MRHLNHMLRNASLQEKLNLIMTISTWAVLFIFLVITLIWQASHSLHVIKNETQSLAELAAESNAAAIRFEDREGADNQLNFFRHIKSISSVQIYTSELGSEPFASFYGNDISNDPPTHTISFINGVVPATFNLLYYSIRMPVIQDGDEIGSVIVQSRLRSFWLEIIASLLVALCAMFLASFFIRKFMRQLILVVTGPVYELNKVMRQISSDSDYSKRAEAKSSDEIGDLVNCFNAMLDQIDQKNKVLAQYSQELESQVQFRTTELIAAKNRADEANQAKSQFLANMSHEIRTPLNGLIGVAEMLGSTEPTDQQKKLISMITSSSSTLLYLINDILDFSKIEAGMLQLENVSFNPASAANQVLCLFAPHAQDKGLKLELKSIGESTTIFGDPHRFIQVASNLLSNAIKFTNSGKIDLCLQQTSLPNGRASIRLSVTDSGIGISAEQAQRLFNPFSQADASMARRYGGSGLGLVISRQLAELMGGHVGFTSEPGLGSCFWIEIEGQTGFSAAPPQQSSSAPVPAKLDCTVLVAEDNDVNREILVTMLKASGCTVIQARNGLEALNMSEYEHHDLVLMDVQMPEMDGIAATRGIRARELAQGHPRKPILAITANALADDKSNCLDAGMDDYLTKPFMRKQILDLISKWLVVARASEMVVA